MSFRSTAALVTTPSVAASDPTLTPSITTTVPGVGMLVVIDPSIEAPEMIMAGVLPGATVLLLNSQQNAIEQITEKIQTIRQQSGLMATALPLQSLHLITHGEPGKLLFSHGQLDLETLEQSAHHLQQWFDASDSESGTTAIKPDLILYGCHVATSEIGRRFLDRLYAITGANIAAAAHPVGQPLRGGTWLLTATRGRVSAPLAIDEFTQRSYDSLLAASQVTDLNPLGASFPGDLTVFNDQLYFRAHDGVTGFELWRYDGNGVPVLAEEINQGFEGSYPAGLTVWNDTLYFSAFDEDIYTNASPLGIEFWSYTVDGGATLIQNIFPTKDSRPQDFTPFNNKLFFAADDGANGRELWIYDQSVGAKVLQDINPGAAGSQPNSLTVFNNQLYFSASTAANGAELWQYDGLNPATPVEDIYVGATGSAPFDLTVFDGKLYFSADSSLSGQELWVYDGTNPARLVQEINPGYQDANPEGLTVFNNQLYFRAEDGIHGSELWSYDGVNVPSLVHDINPGAEGSSPFNLTVFNNQLFFSAYTATEGEELWRYDGVNAPSIVQDIDPGVQGSAPESLTIFDDKLYFKARSQTDGEELWVYEEPISQPDQEIAIREAQALAFASQLFDSFLTGFADDLTVLPSLEPLVLGTVTQPEQALALESFSPVALIITTELTPALAGQS